MSKILKKTIVASLFIATNLTAMAQTEVTITMKEGEGEPQIFMVEDAGSLYFDDKENLLIDQVGTSISATIATSAIRTITFGKENAVEENSAEGRCYIFPNPTANTINFAGIRQGSQVKIFTPEGLCVSSFTYNGEEKDIRNLSKGLYIVTVDGITFKLEKK